MTQDPPNLAAAPYPSTEGFDFAWIGDAYAPDRLLFVSPAVRRYLVAGDASQASPLESFLDRFVHPDDRESTLAAWVDGGRNGRRTEHELRLRRSDGVFRWMHATAAGLPERGDGAFVVHAFDIEERKRIELRLGLLVRAGEMFHRSLDLDATLENIARLAVESFCDFCVFDLRDERSERLYVSAIAHRDPTLESAGRSVSELLHDAEWRPHPVLTVSKTGVPFFVPEIADATIEQHAASQRHADFMRRLGYRSKLVVPVTAHSEIFGALTFVLTSEGRRFDTGDLEFAQELGRRAGVAVANAKRYHREQYVAETLQRAFLTREFPNKAGLHFNALYRPGVGDAEIGGDWYDAFTTPRGDIAIAIGDVAGKGVEAARIMVQLRQAIRAAAVLSDDPAQMMRLVNDVLIGEGGDSLATAFIGVIDKNGRTMRYASAGHAPPFVRHAGGSVKMLESPAAPLGVSLDIPFQTASLDLERGMMVVLYTDGVSEATRDVIAGERLIAEVVASEAIVHAADPARFLERALGGIVPHDDVAILTMRVGAAEEQWRFESEDPRAAYAVKSEFVRTIADFCGGDEDVVANEIIFAELIGNAVRHAPGPLSLAVATDGGAPVLHMIDHGPGFDYNPKLPRDIWAESGRGLYLVAALAREVRVERLPGFGAYLRVALPFSKRSKAA